MRPKDRVIAALHREVPDRVPTGENAVDGNLVDRVLGREVLYNKGWEEMTALWDGRRDEIARDYGRVHAELPVALEWDYVRVPAVPAAKAYAPPRMTGEYSWIDEQGCEVHFRPEAGNIVTRSAYPELAVDDLPDPDEPFEIDESQLEAVRHVVEAIGDSHFVIARTPVDGSFPWQETVGMESLLVKMVTDEAFVEKAVAVWVNRSIAWINAFIDAGADGIMTTDDYSDNRGPIMGPDLFRRFVLPGIERQCRAVHDRDRYFIKHTDGNLWAVLDDLVEIGIDAWHGIQRNIGMDFFELKRRYGDRLCLFGGVNTETMITGTPDDVREEVRTAIEATGGGGLVVTCSNVVPPGASLENYRALREAVREYGA